MGTFAWYICVSCKGSEIIPFWMNESVMMMMGFGAGSDEKNNEANHGKGKKVFFPFPPIYIRTSLLTRLSIFSTRLTNHFLLGLGGWEGEQASIGRSTTNAANYHRIEVYPGLPLQYTGRWH